MKRYIKSETESLKPCQYERYLNTNEKFLEEQAQRFAPYPSYEDAQAIAKEIQKALKEIYGLNTTRKSSGSYFSTMYIDISSGEGSASVSTYKDRTKDVNNPYINIVKEIYAKYGYEPLNVDSLHITGPSEEFSYTVFSNRLSNLWFRSGSKGGPKIDREKELEFRQDFEQRMKKYK